VLLKPLKEETLLLYKKREKRAITRLEIAQKQEQDALRQRRCNNKAAATSAAANSQLEV
jgi:hypothetical protein